MPEAIESRTFRKAARRNCISYLGLLIYVTSVPSMYKHAYPTFRTQSPNGAVSQLFSTLVNMNSQIEQIRKGLRMQDSHPVPGVTWDDASSMQMSLSGPMYFENRRQYESFANHVSGLREHYGWIQSTSTAMSSAVYRPAKEKFTNVDPVQSAIKGMVMHAASDMMDAMTVASATDAITEGSQAERDYFAARDRMEGGSMFNTMAIQYYSNTPVSVQNSWNDVEAPKLLVDNRPVFSANIGYLPTSLDITPGAFVTDSTGFYPTRVDISISMANPLGGILANFSQERPNTANKGEGGVTPASYLPEGVNY